MTGLAVFLTSEAESYCTGQSFTADGGYLIAVKKNNKNFKMTDKPYKTTFKSLYDMEAHIGKEFGLSDWITIDQDSINAFAKLTDDEQWIHIDPVRCAKESPYKKPIAHGFMVLSLASKFAYEVMTINDLTFGLNYGFDKIRFMNATPVGARVRARFTMMEFEKKEENSAKYKMKIIFEIEGVEKPACIAEWLGMGYTA